MQCVLANVHLMSRYHCIMAKPSTRPNFTIAAPSSPFFYPKNNAAICTKEACAFRDAYEDFGAAHENGKNSTRFSMSCAS